MDLKSITVTEIIGAMTVYSEKGKRNLMKNRGSYGLSLSEGGEITYIQNGKEYTSSKSCAVILPKGGNYFIRREKTGRFPLVNFDCLEFLCDTVTVIPIRNADDLIADYERIKKLICFDGNRALILSIFYGMLHKLSSSGIPRELASAVRMINSDYCDSNITNAALAATCNISEVYFRKLFAAHFGVSPKQYIIDLRIQKAKQLLSENSLSVSLISEKCGFSNLYHFSRLFKQHTGVTPTEYRRANTVYEI